MIIKVTYYLTAEMSRCESDIFFAMYSKIKMAIYEQSRLPFTQNKFSKRLANLMWTFIVNFVNRFGQFLHIQTA